MSRRAHGWLLAAWAVAVEGVLVLNVAWYAQTHPAGPVSRQLEAVESAPAVLQFGGVLGLVRLFPTGRPLSAGHARIVSALWWYVVVGVVLPSPLAASGRPNPFGIGPLWLRDVRAAGRVGVVVFVGLGVAASRLAAAAVFGPVRGQQAVDRRFDRARHDVDREIGAFSRRLRGEIDVHPVAAGICGVVDRTLAPSTVVWRTPRSTR